MFPVHSPKIERIEVAARGDVRRAKLYYLRDRVGKRARVRERRYTGPEQVVESGLLYEPTQATDADGATAEEVVLDAEGIESASSVGGAEDGQGASTAATDAADPPSDAGDASAGDQVA